MNEDDLNNFRNNSESSENSFENFKDTSEREVELKDFNEDFNENQLKTEKLQLKSKEMQQRLSQYIIYNYT